MGIIALIILGFFLFAVGCFGIGYAVCDEEPAGWVGVLAAGIGVFILIGCFDSLNNLKQTDVSICIMENIETVEEVKTNGEIVEYKLTFKDGKKITVKPQKKDE